MTIFTHLNYLSEREIKSEISFNAMNLTLFDQNDSAPKNLSWKLIFYSAPAHYV